MGPKLNFNKKTDSPAPDPLGQAAREIEDSAKTAAEVEADDLALVNRHIDVENVNVLSTGSTLLDLCISGKRRSGGGVPGGIVVEIFGPSGLGKTAILAEICGNAQAAGGDVDFEDPEARLDQEYSRIYGVRLKERFSYKRPDTVTEMFANIIGWKPKPTVRGAINVSAGDSIAALSTDMELNTKDGDVRGQRRAKEFSQELRKTCRLIAKNNHLVVFSNQIRQGDGGGYTTPGGEAVRFYASIRIQLGYPKEHHKLAREREIAGSKVKTVIGITTRCQVVKSSIDEPYRECLIHILFGYGIDDIRGNLMYCKAMTGAGKFDCFGEDRTNIENAIQLIEAGGLEQRLKERTIEVWHDVQKRFVITRKPKLR